MFISQSTTNLHTTLKSASSFPSTYSSFLIGSHSSIAPEHATFFPSPTQRVRRAYNRTTVTIQSMRVLLHIQENLRGYLDFMYTKLYTLHCSKTSGPNYKTSLSRCSAVPRSKSLHASAPWFLVDLARDLHRRQYKMQVPWLHAYMNMPVSSEENLQQTRNRRR